MPLKRGIEKSTLMVILMCCSRHKPCLLEMTEDYLCTYINTCAPEQQYIKVTNLFSNSGVNFFNIHLFKYTDFVLL